MPLFTLTRVSERFVVTGGNRLSGEVAVGGAKNSVLKLMAASLLAEGTSTITNCPDILDVPLMAEVLRGLGATVELDGGVVRITSPDELKYDADFAAVRQFRASVCVLGPLVGRCKRAKVALPGGDAIGSRPLDMHQAGFGSWARHAISSTVAWSPRQITCVEQRFSSSSRQSAQPRTS